MSRFSAEIPSDPRIRRTRRLLQDALQICLAQKSFGNISITDICKQADIARVTFYQHYDSKEALLLAGVAEFFANLYQMVDQDVLNHYLDTGDMQPFATAPQMNLQPSDQVQLVGVALKHIGSDVRKLTIQSFLETFSQREAELSAKEVEVLATFYVGGVLTLLEQFLNGQLSISRSDFQLGTLTLLRALRQGMLQSSIFPAGNDLKNTA